MEPSTLAGQLQILRPLILFGCLFGLLSVSEATAQNRIEGRLIAPSGFALPESVPVTLRYEMGSVVSSTAVSGNGRFSFGGLRPGKYVVSVRADGFRRVEQSVEIDSGFLHHTVNVVIQLRPDENGRTTRRRGSENTVPVKSLQVPEAAVKALEEAEKAASKRKYEEAIRHAQTALKLYPDFFEARNNLGVYFYQNGQRRLAIQQLERALEINPRAGATNLNLGRIYLEESKPEQAVTYLDRATGLLPTSAEANYYRAKAFIMLYEFRKAVDPLQNALTQEPPIAHARFLLAHVFWELGRKKEAVREMERYIETSKPRQKGAEATLADWKSQLSP